MRAESDTRFADDPELTNNECFTPSNCANSFSKASPFRTKREPKVQGRGDRRFHFVFCENTPRVGHGSVARHESRTQRIVARTISRVNEAGILPGQSKDFLFQFGCVHKSFFVRWGIKRIRARRSESALLVFFDLPSGQRLKLRDRAEAGSFSIP